MLTTQKYFLLLITLFFVHGACASPTAYTHGLLWKIERAGRAPSYVFGTIHSEDDRVLALPKPVQRVFKASRNYAMEVVVDENTMRAVMGAMMFSDGRTLQQTISAKTYEKVVAAMAGFGMPEQAVQMMKPWALAVTLSMPKPKTGRMLDAVLMQMAVAQGKQITGLETIEEQLGVLDQLSTSEQATMLEDTLKHLPEMDEVFVEMHTLYLARDLAGLVRISDDMLARGNRELGEKMMYQLVDVRNGRMVQRMEAHLKQGNAFIAIGALHLPGEVGVLSLLARKGYRVSVVY